jgi:TM2 domain-containing membrane protein YozV
LSVRSASIWGMPAKVYQAACTDIGHFDTKCPIGGDDFTMRSARRWLDSEARRLKIAGFVSLAVAFPTLFFPGESLTTREWLASADLKDIAGFSAMWLLGGNLFAVGLILLLAGLGSVPLLTSRRARLGAWTKLAGANLLMVCLAAAALYDAKALPPIAQNSWVQLPALIIFIVVGRKGVMLLRTGWKYEAPSASQLLEQDPRPPVVFLRSFQDDDRILLRPPGLSGRLISLLFGYIMAISPEQELAMIMSCIGPVVAIGKPGEPLPELGAARLYVGDDEWRDTIGNLIRTARLVLIRAGSTQNLWWEIEQALTLLPLQRVLLVSLETDAQTDAFDRRFASTFGAPIAPPAPQDRAWLSAVLWRIIYFDKSGQPLQLGKIIYFDESGQPHQQPIRLSMKWVGVDAVLTLFRPYRYTVAKAMKAVFTALDLPWATRRSQTSAVLLALLGGMLGLHHFYLGNRRWGYWYLGLCWLIVPMFLGWIDAIRFALVDAEEFERKYLR